MIDLAMEKRHLAQADRDIAEGETRVAQQTERVEHMRTNGISGLSNAEHLLQTLSDTLQTWRNHRANIVDTIAEMEKGELGPKPSI